jgi:glutamine---fructose-6-phosphate transaminase (isomerizing)
MCGIFAILHKTKSNTLLAKTIDSLEILEYRGYDSCGIFNSDYQLVKTVGRVTNLRSKCVTSSPLSWVMGHTRWATHGIPSVENAHPHISADNSIIIVHNGIIENHKQLKALLPNNFYGTTDSEILANYIQYICDENRELDFKEILAICVNNIQGSYSVVIYNKKYTNTLFLLRNKTPLLIGVNSKGIEISSDILTFGANIKSTIDLPDYSLTVINKNATVKIYSLIDLSPIKIKKHTLNASIITASKGKYHHHMLKEIMNQASTLRSCLRGRIVNDVVVLDELDAIKPQLLQTNRILICACGTSYYSGLLGKYILEEFGNIAVDVEHASEYRYRKSHFDKHTIMIVISQSGETADTLGALEKYVELGGTVLSICNVLGSTIAKNSTCNIGINVGPEIGVASTKAFTGQLCVLYLLAIWMATHKSDATAATAALKNLPELYETFLQTNHDDLRKMAKTYSLCNNMLFMGRGYNYPVALEGALKVKEISYIHAEGYSAAEMKHGPIALIDNMMPIVFIAIKDNVYDKVISNLQEIKSRGGKVIGIINEDNDELDHLLDDIIKIPTVATQFYPFLCILPIQLFSYYLALERGCHIDQPRNLAKSVTVE